MKNIKTIKVIEPIFNLNVGDTLTRLDENSNFTNVSELAGEGYLVCNSISLDPDVIGGLESFEVSEYFVAPKKKITKDYVESLEKELFLAKLMYEKALDLLAESEGVGYNQSKELEKITKRIDTKLEEFIAETKKLDKTLANEFLSGERMEWADEASTVYYNMIDLLKKLKA